MVRLLPRFAASRWKRAAKYVFLMRAAAQAAWFKVQGSQRFPLRVLPLLRLPARSLLPGHIPTQDARLLPLRELFRIYANLSHHAPGGSQTDSGIEVHNVIVRW
jgi:hypothetical protein